MAFTVRRHAHSVTDEGADKLAELGKFSFSLFSETSTFIHPLSKLAEFHRINAFYDADVPMEKNQIARGAAGQDSGPWPVSSELLGYGLRNFQTTHRLGI